MTGSEPSKTSGNIKAATGAVKQNVGSALGNEQMQAEGAGKRAEGNTEHKTAEAKGYAEGAGDSLLGGIKNTAGKIFGNEQMQAEGKGREMKGDAKKAVNS
ncbi:hypothetical protein WJX72_010411 [[Myrmecia] bisecta]|uniref:CsbD-like domain-containing protein n=1 Tax=[Myrmecia] bisecta TaxID=41462 RepID=A0AAW1R9K9_9CHLO